MLLLGGVSVLGPPGAAAQEAPAPPPEEQVAQSRRTAITQAVETVSPAVVTVTVQETRLMRDPRFEGYDDAYVYYFLKQSPYREEAVQGTGSGFVVSPDGYIVTNEHVVGNATAIEVLFPDGRAMDATLVGTDEPTDLALLKVEADDPLPHVDFETETAPIVGEWVIAFGNPFGLFEASEPSVSVGGECHRARPARRVGGAALPRHDPDGRGHQSGQLRRPARQRGGDGDRGEHDHL